jgi:outer membrane immunogenic protein
MNKPLSAVLLTGLISSSVFAQSAFEGAYGQLGSGYENNSYSNLNSSGSNPTQITPDAWSTGNQSSSGAPLIIGLGYYLSATPNWLLGLGVDYSALTQQTSSFSSYSPTGGVNNVPATINGYQLQTSNRFNIFVTPGYVIDKDKLVYLKAGYSSVSMKETYPNTITKSTGTDPLTAWSKNPSATVSGYVLGLGYKQMIANGFYGFAEANYMSYGKPSFSATNGLSYTVTNSPSLSTYQALVGIGYKF